MSEKGKGLIKKSKNTLPTPEKINKGGGGDFSFQTPPVPPRKEIEVEVISGPVKVPEPEKRRVRRLIGKRNSIKSIKVPEHVHKELNLLGNFMDQSTIYVILEELIDSYVEHKLSPRQQKQFRFMTKDEFNNK